jgi:phage terminase small subunit
VKKKPGKARPAKASGKKTEAPVTPAPKEPELTPKQETFCREYLKDLNQTQAAIRSGYSEKTAQEQSSRLLSKVIVQRRVQELMNARAERTDISADYVLQGLQEVAERCMQRAPVKVRRGREFVQMTDDEGRNVWKFDSMGAVSALNLLGKHLKLFTDKVEHSGKITLADVLASSWEKEEG